MGTHAIRHRAADEIANSGVPIKDGMAMTGHKTVEMFLRYVHPDEERIRRSVAKVGGLRRKVVSSSIVIAARERVVTPSETTGSCTPRTAQGNYRPYRNRNGANRPKPPQQCEVEITKAA